MNWLNGPHLRQSEVGWCLPACVAMVAAYWQQPLVQADIARSLDTHNVVAVVGDLLFALAAFSCPSFSMSDLRLHLRSSALTTHRNPMWLARVSGLRLLRCAERPSVCLGSHQLPRTALVSDAGGPVGLSCASEV